MTEGSRRRSIRLQNLAEARAQEIAFHEVQPTESPIRKRRRASSSFTVRPLKKQPEDVVSTHGKKKRGRLWRLPEMPLDILFEIFELLHPSDLLRLSRTSKSLRSCLLNPSATTVWKRTRGNVEGIPECPPNLTESQYAHLIFEHVCHFCGTSGITDVLWECWVRSCHKCIDKNFISQEEVDLELPMSKDHDMLRFIWDPRPRQYDRLYLKSEVIALSKKFSAAKSKADTDALIEDTVAIKNDMKKVRHQRAVELNKLRKDRMQGIRARMEAQGWAEEFDKMNWTTKREYMRHPSVKQAKPVTDRIWRNIEASMTQLFTKFRADRLRRERIDVLCKRLDILKELHREEVISHPPLTPLPDAGDLFEILEFKEIIFRPSEVEVNHASFDLPMLRFEYHAAQWMKTVHKTLRALLPDPVAPDETTERSDHLLSLATTFFRCAWCARPIPYPQIIVHKCMHQCIRFTSDDFEAQCLQHLRTEPWLRWGEKLEFDTVASRTAELLVRACGKDVKSTSYCDMEHLEEFFIYHATTTHRQPDLEPIPWSLLPVAYKAEMQEEQDSQRHDIIDRLHLMCCMRCRAERMTPQELVAHFVIKHQSILDELREDTKCFYVHPDVSDRCTPREARLKIREIMEDEVERAPESEETEEGPQEVFRDLLRRIQAH
ncbi:hypothetical protein NEOLEDRAFT_45258 [Neolentinus lepideus HHB14362 ss-1]|uniref:F-box domain-containing protein n=1 Tax=Neolentinus lepideus HHB14362 ss-1 TaxID=1314782 RepID=A0A165WAJ2_9AGAM|nr:hypothetical protein NEOLEDRAFT_45258 [Neolentinus lepideus HHB14362 ss-1]